MLKMRIALWLTPAAIIMAAGSVLGQNYPNKPIRILTTGVAGSADIAARLLAPELAGVLRQQLVVDNRLFPEEIVAKSTPDGYTLLAMGGSFYLTPLLKTTPYDPIKQFTPITLVETFPFILIVSSSLPVKSVSELIALAKSRPGELNYGSGGVGGGNHLGPELFKAMAGVNIVRVSYKSGSVALNGLLGGEVQLMVNPPETAAPHVKSGKLRALAVTSAQPSALAPGLPTIAASGLPGYEVVSLTGMWAPAGTPAAIINQLNQEILRVLKRPEMKDKILGTGAEIVGSSPAQFAATIKSEMAKWDKVFKNAGITAD